MKTKSTQSAFFNVRVLIALLIVLAGTFVALAGFGVFSATAANLLQALQKNQVITHSTDPLVPVGFDCSKIHQLGIDKQENFRAQAIMIACGQVEGSYTPAVSGQSTLGPLGCFAQKLLAPLAYGSTDVDVITGPETSPNVTQSETYSLANPDNPLQVLVAYNDSRGRNASPINISGTSYSTDGGVTFTRITCGTGQSPFTGTLGDPVALYHRPSGTWLTIWLDTGCGGQGLGGYKTTTPLDCASWTHFCVFSESNADRESGWAENNTSSPFYGRLYISYNDFTVGGGALFSTYSTDGGSTWHAPIPVTSSFIRDVQITGDMAGNGTVYIAGMDEMGGGTNYNRANKIYRSTDGGNTWTNVYTSPIFVGPGIVNVGYFTCMFSDGGGYWSHEGWGEPAAYNNVVSLVYAQCGGANPCSSATDHGDVYYIRSTDSGATFGSPLRLNTDSTTRPQWEPNISASPTGTLFATWYDGREFPSCTRGDPAVPCYRMWSRKSNDNGVTWQPDMALSDVASPLPAQNDPGIRPTYAGDYDYGTAIASNHRISWNDGRVAIGGSSQQDVFTDRELVGFGVINMLPACGSTVNVRPTDFVVGLSDAVNPATVQGSDFLVNNIPANTFILSNGNTTITFHFNTSPVTMEGLQTITIGMGAFNRASDNMPNQAFACTFCYAITPLQVTSTVPAVNGTFSPPAPGNYTFDVNFNQPVDPASVSASDLTITGDVGGSVTAVTLINGGTTARFTLHFNFGGSVTLCIGPGAIVANTCNGNAAFCGNYTVQGCPPADHYTITQSSCSIVPGTTDIGNHGDDQVTNVVLPFSYTLYDQTFTSVNLSSNGNAQFTTTDTAFTNTCLPWTTHNYTIFPYWDDLYLVNATFGIFTSVNGTAPNRIFNIEWRAQYFPGSGGANFELRLYEGQTHFDLIHGTVTNGNSSATAGVQKNDTTFDQLFCNGLGNSPGCYSFSLVSCNQVTVTSAVSRELHAGVPYDINMPQSGPSGVEDRTTGGTNDYSLVVTFSGSVTVTGNPQAAVTTGSGCVGTGGVCNGNTVTVSGATVTVPLTNITNAQVINVRIFGVNGAADAPAADFDFPMGFLIGDDNGNRTVNAADIALCKSQLGQAVTAANFRSDVNANGAINAADVALIKGHSGTSIP